MIGDHLSRTWKHFKFKIAQYITRGPLIVRILRHGAAMMVSLGSKLHPKLYIPSTPNNSNETHTLMCLGRTGRFGQR